MSGKGDTPRPIPDRAAFESNWDRIFGSGKLCAWCGRALSKHEGGQPCPPPGQSSQNA